MTSICFRPTVFLFTFYSLIRPGRHAREKGSSVDRLFTVVMGECSGPSLPLIWRGGREWLENSLMEADKGRTPCGRNKGLKKETETEWRYKRWVEGRRSPVRCSERRQQGWSWRWRDEVVLLFPAGLGCGHHWPGDLKCTVLLWVLPHSLHSVCQVFSRVRCLVSGRGSARVRPNADLIYFVAVLVFISIVSISIIKCKNLHRGREPQVWL